METHRKCMNCHCDYKHNEDTLYSEDIKEYCKYLGCCKEKCWNKLPRRQRNDLMLQAFIYNHKKK